MKLLTPSEAGHRITRHPGLLAWLHRQGLISAVLTPGGHRRYTEQEVERARVLLANRKPSEA